MKNKGFSLIELIVVISIIAVLVGVIAPQFFGYTKRAKESVAKDEIYNLVKTANINLIENEIEAKYTFVTSNNAEEAPVLFVDETIDKANAKGVVSSMLIALSSVTYTKYTSLNGVTAIYDITKSPNIYIDESDNEPGMILTAYYDLAKKILGEVDVTKQTHVVTHSIQEAYANQNGGEHPMFVGSIVGNKVSEFMVAAGLKYHSGTNADELKWIPSSTDDKKDVIMYAGTIANDATSGNIIKASIAYYDGNYYYHDHGYIENQISNVHVGDRGKDTVTFKKLSALTTGTKIDGWVKFEQ